MIALVLLELYLHASSQCSHSLLCLQTRATDSRYRLTKSLYNDVTKSPGDADTAKLRRMREALTLTCSSAVATDATGVGGGGGGARREKGILSSLFTSLAVLHFKTGEALDATDAAGKSVAYSPVTELRSGGSDGVASRLKELA
jgi:hypothetical protein